MTYLEIYQNVKRLIPPELREKYDHLSIGMDKFGCHYIIPVQAKGGNDQISIVQTTQDINCCTEKHPGLRCHPISAQFISSDQIALFELKFVLSRSVITS